jgi:putative ABC transport system permease protein
MRHLVNLWLRLKALVLRRRLERDLEEELSFHLAMREADYAASGVAGAAAQEAARRRFGNPTHYKQQLRDMWTFPSFESIWQDVRYAVRTLRKAPGFTLVAVFALALGIGGNTAIFSLVDAVRLRALPYAHAERLVVLWGNVMRAKVERRGASYPDFLDWRAQATSFDGMAACDSTRMTLSGVDEARRIVVETVSAPYFSLLGIDAARGRTFLASEDVVPQKIAVTVLADGFWKRQFSGDPQIIGRTILLNAQPFTVVGIMPAGFRGLTDSADVWIPFVMSDTAEGLAQRGTRGFQVLARLKPGVAIAQAQTELDAISRRLEQAYPETNEKRAVEISPLDVEMFGQFRLALAMLMAAVGFVLLIACANVANLLIARSEARQREIAVRTALGAGWPRLLRQLITESCVLTSLGAVAGLVLAKASIRALVSASPIDFPSFVDPHVDMRVAVFTVLVSLGCGLLLGLAPALHGRVSRLAEALKDTARGSDGRRSQRLRSALVVAEVSLAVVLLVGAGLMIRSVQKLTALDPGFDPESVLTLRVSIPRAAAPPSADSANAAPPLVVSARTLLERARAIPGVMAASLASDPPLSGLDSAIFYTAEGQPPMTAQNRPRAYVHRITPEFFSTMRIPIRQGRTFAETESSPDARVVVVSERVATRFWPGQDPIGKRIKTGGATSNSPWLSIVGVVAEVKYRGLPENPTADPDLYFPFLDRNQQVSLVLRTSVPPATIAPVARAAIREVDSTIPVFAVATMAELMSSRTSQLRFTTWLMGFFAAVALLLASVGIYGVMSYLVTQRTREIGIRLALGATAGDILRLIVGNGARLIVAGIVIGIAASFGLAQLVRTLLFGVTTADAATGIAIAVLAGVSLAACYLPALRASRVDPLVALHYE